MVLEKGLLWVCSCLTQGGYSSCSFRGKCLSSVLTMGVMCNNSALTNLCKRCRDD